MSRQSSLDKYFKPNKLIVSPGLPKSIMDSGGDKVARKRSLSLKKSEILQKSPKLSKEEIKSESSVIDLCSDDESSPHNFTALFSTPTKVSSANGENRNRNRRLNFDSSSTPTTSHAQPTLTTPPNKDDGHESDSSDKTIIYSPSTTPQTPRRAPATPSSSFRSPSSGKKYFSPIKKRAVSAKKPVVRNLARNLADCPDNNELFDEACLGMDDKTIFLLTIINKCYCNPSLYRLMDEASQSMLLKFMHAIKPGMRLVCRLYWHQDRWYKLDKIRTLLSRDNETVDEPTLHNALRFLEENELITLGGSDGNLIGFDDLTTVLSADELKQICKDLKLKINSKQGAIAALKSYSREKSLVNYYTPSTNNNSNRVLKIMSLKAGPCYKLSDLARRTIYELHILMYLGINYNVIREKNLELTLLNYKINREVYPIEEIMLDDASVVFKDRQDFKRYVDAHNVFEMYLTETDLNKKCEIVTNTFDNFNNITETEMSRYKCLPLWLRRFTPMNIYVKILETGVQDLKKENRFGIALEILQALISQDTCRRHKRAEWYAEKALILHKCSRSEEAAKVLLEGFKSDITDQAKDTMRPRAKTLAKQKGLGIEESIKAELLEYANKEEILEKNLRGVHFYKQPMERTKQKGKLKFETRTSDERIIQDVEEYCLSHYINSEEFTDGMHWEGRIVTTIFFLLFWDIIYWKPHDCPGVFLTLFQKFPLDLFCESFYSNRRDLIEARLALVERCSGEQASETIIANWNVRPENELSGMSREGMRAEHVAAVARALGGRALTALCRRLARDYRHAHSGFPDLTLWNTRTNKIRFVEVKSDTDKPSMKQIQWMHYLQQHGIDTEFCYVGVNTTRCKARSFS